MSTKKLAKELGLLRQRSQTSGHKKTLLSNQIFSYLIVIDFESTCWREKNNQTQEIIEFPAVLLNTSSGDIESEFHTYVQPQEHPVLSEFCTELTGITQTQVEAGVPLHICLSQFSRWLQKLQHEKAVVFPNKQQGGSAAAVVAAPSQKLCTFLTWSDWDLGVCLQFECKRKQIHKPDVVNSWIDLRSTYRLFYNKKPKGLNGALQDLGIQFSGREHSGLDDARNTARLAVRMMRDGCVMKITRSLERTPSVVRPPPRPANGKKETPNLTTKEKGNATKRPSSTTTPPAKSCPGNKPDVLKEAPNSVEPVCQSLISPKTLLNGTNVQLWGNGGARLSSHGSDRSRLLCSTVVGCLPRLPQLDSVAGEPMEGEGEELFTEVEDRCGSYDDVVLEGDDVAVETEAEYVSEFDSENRVPLGGTGCGEKMKTINQPATSKGTNKSGARVSALLNPGGFAAPRPVTWKSRTGAQTSRISTNGSKMDTSSLLRGSFFIPEKTSTPHGSTSGPRGASTRHKETPKVSSFSIYADPVNQSAASSSSSRDSSRKALSSLSTNTFNVSALMKAGWKSTAPLCACGRRAKRLQVSNGGPNQGRGFYCCAVRRSGSGCRVQEGCQFFQWEVAGGSRSSPAARGSVSLCHMNSTLGSRPPQRAAPRKSY